MGPAGWRTNAAPWAFFSVQNQDGVCVQSVSVILHQDPRRQVTLTQAGDVLLFDQYKVTPPYTDGMALVDEIWLGAGCPGSSGQTHGQELMFYSSSEWFSQGPGPWNMDSGLEKWSLSPPQHDNRWHCSMMASPTLNIRMELF